MPSGLQPPTAAVQANGSVLLSWQPPAQPNGLVTSYSLYGARLLYTGLSLQYLDSSVLPGNTYSYFVLASTSAASVSSSSRVVNTPERTPVGMSTPLVTSVTPTVVSLSWTAPQFPNGAIFTYRVEVNGTAPFSGLVFAANITGLLPYTAYTLLVAACNSAGCVRSAAVLVNTQPAGELLTCLYTCLFACSFSPLPTLQSLTL